MFFLWRLRVRLGKSKFVCFFVSLLKFVSINPHLLPKYANSHAWVHAAWFSLNKLTWTVSTLCPHALFFTVGIGMKFLYQSAHCAVRAPCYCISLTSVLRDDKSLIRIILCFLSLWTWQGIHMFQGKGSFLKMRKNQNFLWIKCTSILPILL